MAYAPESNGRLWIPDGSGTREEVRLLSDVTYTPTGTTTSTRETLDRGPVTRDGEPGAGTATFSYEPHPGSAADIRLENTYFDAGLTQLEHERGTAKIVRANAVTADTLALALIAGRLGWGTITGAGALAFGADLNPLPPWQEGLGIVFDSMDELYMVEQILTGTTLLVRYYGDFSAATGLAQKFVPPAAAITPVSATPNWNLLQMGVRNDYYGRVQTAGGEQNSPGGEVSSDATINLVSRRVSRLIVPAIP